MNDSDRTLWMGDLEPYMDANFIGESFARMGEEVGTVKIVYDKYSGRAAGYCFVELADSDSARRAMLNINGKVVPKSKPPVTFNLSFANSPTAPYTEYNLFVNNVAYDIDDAGLFLIFGERYRSCRGAKVYRNADGTSKGLGFVRFADQTDQQRALVEMNKYRVRGKEIVLKLAQPKYRAPKAARMMQNPQYDPTNYYPQYQDYYSAGAWPAYDVQQQQQQMQQQQPMMVDSRMMMMQGSSQMSMNGADTQLIDNASMSNLVGIESELEPYNNEDDDGAMSIEDINKAFMIESEDLYNALDDSRWCSRHSFNAATTENDLIVSG